MSDNDAPNNGPFAQSGIVDESIVQEARASIGKMLSTAIEALGKDIDNVLKANEPKQSEIQKAVTVMTIDMIALLTKRVNEVFAEGSDDQDDGGDTTASGKTSDPKSPKSGERK